MPDFFVNVKTYNETFRDSYLHSDSRNILLSYKIHFRLSRLWAIQEKEESKYFYMTRARNLVWALLIQGLLNGDVLTDLRERFGTNMAMEVDCTEFPKKMASIRVRFIVSEAVADSRSQK